MARSVGFIALVSLLIAPGCGVDRNEWIEDNKRVLAGLPIFPGSTLLEAYHQGVEEPLIDNDGDSGLFYRTVSYASSFGFAVPRDVRGSEVAAFYAKRMRDLGWNGRFSEYDGAFYGCFGRGTAFVSISTADMIEADRPYGYHWGFGIDINHDGAMAAIC